MKPPIMATTVTKGIPSRASVPSWRSGLRRLHHIGIHAVNDDGADADDDVDAAAVQTAACMPKNGKMTVAQTMHAAPAPRVLTK